jgi:transposase-like protein
MKEYFFSEKEKQALLRKYSRSGMAVSRFCLRQGISQSVFRTWLKESGLIASRAGGFFPLRLVKVDGQWFSFLIG